jgi:hypothetical protein
MSVDIKCLCSSKSESQELVDSIEQALSDLSL